MRILMVHNDYGRYSGEEAVVDQLIADGRKAGIYIETLRRTSKFSRDNFIGKVHGFISGMYSFSGVLMMREAIRTFQPDIVHIHNLYPFISPSALFECKKANIPVVMTVHNYRLLCPTGLFLRNGHPCEECLVKHSEMPCIKYRCEGSLIQSIGYAFRNHRSRKSGAYMKCVDYFCCLTEFQKNKLIEGGYPPEKMFVFPNYVKIQRHFDEDERDIPVSERKYVGYVGRLSEEKGYDLLLEVARRHPEIQFEYAGAFRDPTDEEQLPNVVFHGVLDQKALSEFYRNSRFIVIPSRCYEGFPIVMLESFGYERTCIAPNHGAFPDLMQYEGHPSGLLFTPSDVDSLEEAVLDLWNDTSRIEMLQSTALEEMAHRFCKRNINKQWDVFLKKVAGGSGEIRD